MAITPRNPNTVFLGGPKVLINDIAAKEAITPGMLVDLDNTGGVVRWKKAATAKKHGTSFANNMPMLNKGIDDACAANDLIEVITGSPGTYFYGIIASGANIANGDLLENAGNGKLRAWTDAGQAFRAKQTVDNSAGPSDARIRVEVV
jgi:hypothetical protein